MKKSEALATFQNLLIRRFPSEATRKTYFSCVKKFIITKHPTDIENLSDKYLTEYLNKVLGENHEHISLYNQTVSSLKMLYNVVLKKKYKLSDEKLIVQKPKLKNLPDYNKVVNQIKVAPDEAELARTALKRMLDLNI